MVRFRKVSIFSSPGAAVLFFLQKRKKRMGAQNVLAEKEKNGFKKAFLWVRRKPEEAGGQGRPSLRVRRKIGGTGGQSRPPLQVRREIGEAGGQGRPPLRVQTKPSAAAAGGTTTFCVFRGQSGDGARRRHRTGCRADPSGRTRPSRGRRQPYRRRLRSRRWPSYSPESAASRFWNAW